MCSWKRNKVLTTSTETCRGRHHHDLHFSSKYGIILSVLSYTGINLFDDRTTTRARRTLGLCFSALLHLSSVDYWLMSYFNFTSKWEEYQLVLSFVFSNTLSLVLWHVLYWKRRSLKSLLVAMDSVCDGNIVVGTFEKSLINWTVFVVIFATPVVYSLVTVHLMNLPDPSYFYMFYTYGVEVENFTLAYNAYLFVKTLGTCLLDPIFTSCVILVYCLLCHRICRLLVATEVRLRTRDLSEARLRKIAADYTRLCAVLERLQSIFSLPSFLLILVDTTSSFTILASAVLYAPRNFTAPLMAENAFIFMTSALFLATTIAFAAQVPVAMRGVRGALHAMHERVVFGGVNPPPSCLMHLICALEGRKIVVLSGCEIVYFTRTTILTALGTLLTYGLLIIQLK